MRALQLARVGVGPSGLDVVEMARPVPEAGEVLIQVHAVSASKLELEQTMAGVGLGRAVRLPRVLGMDPAGVVVAQGADVDGDRVGSRVAVKPNLVCGSCRYCADGAEADCLHQAMLGVHRDGGAAQFVAVPATAAFAIDDALEFLDAAAAVHSVSVALHMLRRAGGPGHDETVLVLGASGAVGSAAVQLATSRGAAVIAAVSSPAKAAASMADGAVATVDSTAIADLATAVRASAIDGANVVVDTTGSPAVLSAAMDSLAWRGVAVTCAGRPGESVAIDLGAHYRSRRSLLGVAGTDFRDVRDALLEVAAGRVRMRIGACLALAQAPEAYRVLADRAGIGKIMVTTAI